MPILIKTEGLNSGDPNLDQVGDTLARWNAQNDKTLPLTLRAGTNGVQGVATLSGGTKTVSTTAIRTGDNILLTRKAIGGTPGNLTYGTITDKTSFVITSSSGADTSDVLWVILRAAA